LEINTVILPEPFNSCLNYIKYITSSASHLLLKSSNILPDTPACQKKSKAADFNEYTASAGHAEDTSDDFQQTSD